MSELTPAGTPIAEAAERLGVTIELLRKRAQRGTIPAHKVDGRWFVVLDSEAAIVQPSGPDLDVQDVPSRTGQAAESPSPRAVAPAAVSQLEAIRDEWLQPLIDRIGTLEHALGKTEEQRDAAIRERDELRAEVALLRDIRLTDKAEEDTDRFHVQPVAEPPAEPSEAPGREHVSQGPESHEHQPSWLVTGWRRLVGRKYRG